MNLMVNTEQAAHCIGANGRSSGSGAGMRTSLYGAHGHDHGHGHEAISVRAIKCLLIPLAPDGTKQIPRRSRSQRRRPCDAPACPNKLIEER